MNRHTVLVAVALLAVGCATAPGGGQPEADPATSVGLATANTTRLVGGDPLADAVAVTQALYPTTISGENVPGAVILAPIDDLAMQVIAVQVTHMPINAPVLFADADGIPSVIRTELRRLRPEGVAQDRNVQIYVVGDLERAAQQAEELGYRVRRFPGSDPVDVARQIDEWKSVEAGDHVPLVAVGDVGEPELMLPVASFYAHAPLHLVWTRDGEVPEATRDALRDRGGDGYLYLIGGQDVLDQDVAAALSPYGFVQRLDASDPVDMSQRNADYGDVSREFSWDIGEPGHNFTFVPASAPPAAVTATALSHLGKHGPMLLLPDDGVPETIRTYLEDLRPTYVAPDQALYNHGWIVGGTDTISLDVQGELDTLLAQQRRPPTVP